MIDKNGLVLEKEKASKLSKGSGIKVLVKCATCSKERNVVWNKFMKGSVNCFKCACLKRVKKMNENHPRGKGKDCHNWKGGRTATVDGYVWLYKPEHPKCIHEKYVLEHRLLMEEKIGRYLEDSEVVHHINGDRQDNRMGNLELMTHSEHSRHHCTLNHKLQLI